VNNPGPAREPPRNQSGCTSETVPACPRLRDSGGPARASRDPAAPARASGRPAHPSLHRPAGRRWLAL